MAKATYSIVRVLRVVFTLWFSGGLLLTALQRAEAAEMRAAVAERERAEAIRRMRELEVAEVYAPAPAIDKNAAMEEQPYEVPKTGQMQVETLVSVNAHYASAEAQAGKYCIVRV